MVDKINMREKLDLHEIISFKTTCATKSAAAINLANDPDLKTLLAQDLQRKKQELTDIQSLLQGGS